MGLNKRRIAQAGGASTQAQSPTDFFGDSSQIAGFGLDNTLDSNELIENGSSTYSITRTPTFSTTKRFGTHSLYLDGTYYLNHNMQMGNNTGRTLSLWILEDGGENGMILGAGPRDACRRSGLSIGGGTIRTGVHSCFDSYGMDTGQSLSTTVWTHVVWVTNFTNDQFYTYVNNVKYNYNGAGASVSVFPNIGGYNDAISGWTGYIDNILYFNRILTDDEVSVLYNQTE